MPDKMMLGEEVGPTPGLKLAIELVRAYAEDPANSTAESTKWNTSQEIISKLKYKLDSSNSGSFARLLRDIECRIRERRDVVAYLAKIGLTTLSKNIHGGIHEGCTNDWYKVAENDSNMMLISRKSFDEICKLAKKQEQVLTKLEEEDDGGGCWSMAECDLLGEASSLAYQIGSVLNFEKNRT